ncbi:Ig-like domain-containing protein [Rhodococcus sp. OK302]|uniref:Ig-like domain-containing protein n=1 Tax=Rhodococcus sp. OK302 TaxID=1882769 RepID=UPI000B9402EC|nr:Ig-like domain-containing protein [Rhodococcus sp. OK302]OYD68490.1 Ig-like domain-containing protein [Rhodococcus sp. OK302]
MSQKNIRRGIGAVSAFAVAAGLAVSFGTGVADAVVPQTVNWSEGNSSFSRTVSNVTPSEGEVITVSTTFRRTVPGVVEYIYRVTDKHPTCLTYVDNSAKVDGSPRAIDSFGADFVQVKGSVIEWPVYPLIEPKSRTFSFDYKVGAGCDRGVALPTGMTYNGDLGAGNYPGQGPAVTVAKNVSTTALAPIAAAQVGTPVNLSATVTGGVVGDTVEFYDGTNKLGSGVLNAAGVATYSWTPATTGSYSLTAKFLATTKASESTSVPQNVTVSAAVAQTTTAITGVGTATTSDVVSLTATVGPNPGGGTVQFKDANGNLGAPVDVDASGKAVLTQAFAEGTHSITAVFSGSAGFGTSTAVAHSLTVSAPVVPNEETTTAITGVGTATTGDVVSLTATVGPNPGGGTVQFKDANGNLGAPVDVDASGKAVLTQAFAEGTHSITAVFSGSAGFGTSTAVAHSLTVTAPVLPGDEATTTVLTVPATAVKGVSTDLLATVSPAPGGGTVQFFDGTTPIGNPVPVVDGKAKLPHTFTQTGDHKITAVFSGFTGHQTSTAPVATVVVSESGSGNGGSGSLGGSGILGSLGGSGILGSLGGSGSLGSVGGSGSLGSSGNGASSTGSNSGYIASSY